jgi:hypothetical protein
MGTKPMNRFVASLAIAFAMYAVPLHAQPSQQVNCAVLANTPLMCVKNESAFPITAIIASSSAVFGSDWIPIPGSQILPGGTTIVRFPTGWGTNCIKYVGVRTASGQVHSYPSVDVCHSTSFIIRGW